MAKDFFDKLQHKINLKKVALIVFGKLSFNFNV